MPVYHYQALLATGKKKKGTVHADSEQEARHILRRQHLIPLSLHTRKTSPVAAYRHRIPASTLALFTRQLATLCASGIPLEEALLGVSAQCEHPKAKQLITNVRQHVLEGYAFAQALGEYTKAFPPLYCTTIAAGEQAGHLDTVLEKLADYTENQQKIRQKIQQALIYPLLMIIVSTSIISFLLAFVVPKIIDVFVDSGQVLPTTTQILMHISHGIANYGLYGILCITLFFLLGIKSLKNPRVKQKWHGFMLRIPLLSRLIRSINIARYMHTFAILFTSGVNILETMHVSATLLNNVVMKARFDAAQLQVKEGVPIHQALKTTDFLNPMTTHLIASGEKSGALTAMMERVAIHLDDEVKRTIDTSLTLLEPSVIMLMGAVVLFIVLATLLPIFSMQQLI